MRWQAIVAIAVVVVALGLFIGLKTVHHAAPVQQQQPAQEPSPVFVPANRSLSLSAGLTKQFFSPANISLRVGDTLTLSLTAIDANHGIYSASTNQNSIIQKGETTQVVLRATTPGTLLVLCNDGCNPGVQFTATVQ